VDIYLDLADCTLSTEHQALVNALNRFLAWLPDDDDPNAALRLAMEILEAADVAPQEVLAQIAGFTQSRSVRVYKQRLREEGLAGLFNRPIPGRPAVTTQTLVKQALIQVILSAVIEEHALPDDRVLATRVNQVLSESETAEAGSVTASMVETMRLRWEIDRPAITQQLQTVQPSEAAESDTAQLGRTRVGGAGDVLAGGETEEAGHMCAVGEAVDVTDLARQGQGIADASANGCAQQLGLRPVLDQAIARLEEMILALVSAQDVLGEILDALADQLLPDRAGEGLTAQGDQVLSVLLTESGATVSRQDSSNGFCACGDECIGEKVVVEQSVDGWVMKLGTGKDLSESGVVGPQQGTELVLLPADLLGQVTGSAGAEAGSEQIGILAQDDFRGTAQTDLFGQSVGVHQFVAHCLGEHFGHVFGGAGVV
jgi:hypothetical protein